MNPYLSLAPLLLTVSTAKVTSCTARPLDAERQLDRAEAAMGSVGLTTLQYSAVGSAFTFGQAYTPGSPWPKVNVLSMTRTLDYESESLRDLLEISRAEPLGGGAYPQSASQKNDQFISGEFSWNVSGTTITPFALFQAARIHQLWVTPHGVLRAARENDPAGRLEHDHTGWKKTITFFKPGALRAKITFDAHDRVAEVESRLPDNLLGETSVVSQYSEYQDFAGVPFPTRVVQTQDGHPLTDLTVSNVNPNAEVAIAVPDAVTNFREKVTSTLVSPGVWFVGGGSHNSAVIEMQDHVVLVESPLSDQRAVAVLAEAARLVPGKPLEYVINSHNHFDHAGGLRAAVAAGATVVTQTGNKAYYERAFATPNTIRPGELERSGKRAKVVGVDDRLVLDDGERSIELHRIVGTNHCDSMLMIYLPAEKLLIEADLFTPGSNPNAPTPAVLDPQKVALVDNIERLGLVIERILPLHGRLATMTELLTAVGKPPAATP